MYEVNVQNPIEKSRNISKKSKSEFETKLVLLLLAISNILVITICADISFSFILDALFNLFKISLIIFMLKYIKKSIRILKRA